MRQQSLSKNKTETFIGFTRLSDSNTLRSMAKNTVLSGSCEQKMNINLDQKTHNVFRLFLNYSLSYFYLDTILFIALLICYHPVDSAIPVKNCPFHIFETHLHKLYINHYIVFIPGRPMTVIILQYMPTCPFYLSFLPFCRTLFPN